jgi:GrpB-like predicted nucleotidyltransferase (UPF0157 family)
LDVKKKMPDNAIICLERGIVRLVPYDPGWVLLFKEEKARLSRALGEWALDIQHVGSTAIPGGVAKPIIDISIAVESFEAAFACVKPMEDLGYVYAGENGIPRRHYFVKRNPATTHHIHMFEITSDQWRDHILFRDYMRSHPEAVQAYTDLKLQLLEQFPMNREAYTEGKAEFIHYVINLGKQGDNFQNFCNTC